MSYKLQIIGRISSVFKSRAECPKQAEVNLPPSKLIVYEEYLDALDGLMVGDEVYVFTWLHKGDRDVLKCYPRGDIRRGKKGVFATRSPDRPNPVGLHRVRILSIEKNVMVIHPIEVIDNTPVIDIKPVDFSIWKSSFGPYIDPKIGKKIIKIGERAWKRRLISGFNGNISVRFQDMMIITKSGCNKGMLSELDLIAFDFKRKEKLSSEKLSSEWKMHYKIYMQQKKAKAILHSHPLHVILAVKNKEDFLKALDVYEADIFMEKVGVVEPLEPGSDKLAEAVSDLCEQKQLIILKNHGLVCWGESLEECLSLSEEFEQLAKMFLILYR
jgi:L-fuculose-phosphate aldolase